MPSGRAITDDQLTTLTESLQNILRGVYMPESFNVLLQNSYTDTVGRVPTAPQPQPAAAAGAAGAASASQPAAAGAAGAAAPAAGTATSSQPAATAGAALGGTAAAQPGAQPAAAGTAPFWGLPPVAGFGAAAAAAPASSRVAYRYTPLAVAALSELVHRADTYLAASLQPHLREAAVSMVATAAAGLDSTRTTNLQNQLRGLAGNLTAAGALLTELARVTAAVGLAVTGNTMPLIMNTAAVIQPDGRCLLCVHAHAKARIP